MNGFAVAALAGETVGATLSTLRWLRVAQREHYEASRTTRFAIRWWRARWYGAALFAIALAAVGFSWSYPGAALLAALIVASGPPGLAIRGRTSKLRWTRRLRTVAASSAALALLFVALVGVLADLRAAALAGGLVLIATPLLVDVVLAFLAPIEDVLGERFVKQAAELVGRIGPRTVAITGSYGKTSTKRYLEHLLAGSYPVVASPRSFNNRAGLSRTVNELLLPGTEVLIAEMGAYGRGEIAALCAWLPPEVAVITTIGPVHLERFRSIDQTVLAKSEIAELAATVVLNIDDPRLAELTSVFESQGKTVIGCSSQSPLARVRVVASTSGLQVTIDRREPIVIELPASRRPSALSNVACTLGAAIGLGASPEVLLARLATLPSIENRLAISRGGAGALVIDDTFNSNPAGAQLALDLLASAEAGGRRVVVTPGMVELGREQFEQNAAFAANIVRLASVVVIVGRTNRRALRAGLAEAGRRLPGGEVSVEVREVATHEAAAIWVKEALGEGDLVLYENDLPDHFP